MSEVIHAAITGFPLIPLLRREATSPMTDQPAALPLFPLIPLLRREATAQRSEDSVELGFPLIPLLRREATPLI